MTGRGWVGFVSLVIAVAGTTVFFVLDRRRATSGDKSVVVLPPMDSGGEPAARVRRVVVPNIVGMRRSDAWRTIADSMLTAAVESVDAGPEKVDVVVSVDPAPGTKTSENTILKVRVGAPPASPAPAQDPAPPPMDR